jgi:pyruvate dehydrogenase E1 component
MPAMPKGKDVREGIIKGMYRFRPTRLTRVKARAHLLGSGAILNEALKAQEILEVDYGVAADVWSVTSYKNLYYDAIDAERHNLRQRPKESRLPYLQQQLSAVEDQIQLARRYYNGTVRNYNTAIESFPGNLVAGRFDFQAAEFFEIETPADRTLPKVAF